MNTSSFNMSSCSTKSPPESNHGQKTKEEPGAFHESAGAVDISLAGKAHESIPSTKPPSLKCISGRKSRIKWTSEEDTKLKEALESFGVNGETPHLPPSARWLDVTAAMKTGRTAKQCRDRWRNYLRPGLKKGGWTEEEEHLINELHATFGPKWSAMAALFENRTDNDIKNKWYSMMRYKERNVEAIVNQSEHSCSLENGFGESDEDDGSCSVSAQPIAQQTNV